MFKEEVVVKQEEDDHDYLVNPNPNFGGETKDEKPWCWYCNRDFDDDKILIQHQKAKHFKCHMCHKKLFSGPGLANHSMQVHKKTIDKIPGALMGRDSTEVEIYGMQGIPDDATRGMEYEDMGGSAKRPRMDMMMMPPGMPGGGGPLGGIPMPPMPGMGGGPPFPDMMPLFGMPGMPPGMPPFPPHGMPGMPPRMGMGMPPMGQPHISGQSTVPSSYWDRTARERSGRAPILEGPLSLGGGRGGGYDNRAVKHEGEGEGVEDQSEEHKLLESWDAFLLNSVDSKQGLPPSPALEALVRDGIPAPYRARVWVRLVQHHVHAVKGSSGYYSKLQKTRDKGVFDPILEKIDLDLAISLSTNKYFADSIDKVDSLRRVLYAYRYHNTEVGYCQGMNRLAAIGLLHLNEEGAFWLLTACVEILQPAGYYTSTLSQAVADQKVLRDLVQTNLPLLYNHLKNLKVDLSLFTLSWFLTCFKDTLPPSLYLPIFDLFLYEGNTALFRFALALLKLGESRVLQCKTIGTVHACLSRASDFVPNFEYEKLSQVAFNELKPLSQQSIEWRRKLNQTGRNFGPQGGGRGVYRGGRVRSERGMKSASRDEKGAHSSTSRRNTDDDAAASVQRGGRGRGSTRGGKE